MKRALSIVLLAGLMGTPIHAQMRPGSLNVSAKWESPGRKLNTILTVDVEPTPIMREGSPVRAAIFKELADLDVDYPRFHAWLSRPRLTVAELEPPSKTATSWDFTLIDAQMLPFLEATKKKRSCINFSTIPQWMFKTPERVSYPDDPNAIAYTGGFNYGSQGTDLVDPSGKQVADYFSRIASWYTKGGFTDENGNYHYSGYNYRIACWEILNELEHRESPQAYTKLYDRIFLSVKNVLPNTEFMGPPLAPDQINPTFISYFLDKKNHLAGVSVDFLSYHHYAFPPKPQGLNEWQYSLFDQADAFLKQVPYIEEIRKRLSPTSRTAINEYGVISPEELSPVVGGGEKARSVPAAWWNLTGAYDAYIFVGLARQGIDIAGATYITGSPGSFPRLSLIDWRTGAPNARLRIIKMINAHLSKGDRLVETQVSPETESGDIEAQAFVTRSGNKELLLINKRARPIDVSLDSSGTIGHVETVGSYDSDKAPRTPANTYALALDPFSVSIIDFLE